MLVFPQILMVDPVRTSAFTAWTWSMHAKKIMKQRIHAWSSEDSRQEAAYLRKEELQRYGFGGQMGRRWKTWK